MKDHQVAKLINDLTDVAKTYAHTEQLRDRISQLVCDFVVEVLPEPKLTPTKPIIN